MRARAFLLFAVLAVGGGGEAVGEEIEPSNSDAVRSCINDPGAEGCEGVLRYAARCRRTAFFRLEQGDVKIFPEHGIRSLNDCDISDEVISGARGTAAGEAEARDILLEESDLNVGLDYAPAEVRWDLRSCVGKKQEISGREALSECLREGGVKDSEYGRCLAERLESAGSISAAARSCHGDVEGLSAEEEKALAEKTEKKQDADIGRIGKNMGVEEEVVSDAKGAAKGLGGYIADLAYQPIVKFGELLGEASSCFVCGIVWLSIGVLHSVSQAAFILLVEPVLLLLLALFPIWLAVQFGKTAAGVDDRSGSAAWGPALAGVLRFVFVLAILGVVAGGAFKGGEPGGVSAAGRAGSSGAYDELMGRVLMPVLELGSVGGLELMSKTGGGGKIDILSKVEEQGQATVEHLKKGMDLTKKPVADIAYVMMQFVQGIHAVGRVGYAKAAGLLSWRTLHGDPVSQLISVALGLLLALLFTQFLIVSGIKLIDPILRVTVVAGLSPLLVAAWTFPSTKSAAIVGLRTIFYAFVYFLVAGLLLGLALALIIATTGVGVPKECLSAYGDDGDGYKLLLLYLQQGGDGFEAVAGACGVKDNDVDFIGGIVTAITIMVAHGLMSQTEAIAGQITDFAPQGGVGEQVEGSVRGLADKGTGVVGATVLGAGSMIGKGIGFLRR